jgi:hypothetical protein
VADAERALSGIELRAAPAMLTAIGELIAFELALRRGHTAPARAALERARHAGERSHIPALIAEIEQAGKHLSVPAARLIARGQERPLVLEEVEAVLASKQLIVDACRRLVSAEKQMVTLARRPVLFALLRALAESWPDAAERDALIWQAFGARRANASHRARLRVELGRLRKDLRAVAEVRATRHGFALWPRHGVSVVVLAPPIEGEDGALLALLADGTAWPTSALALALGSSQRTVQRALATLEVDGRVRSLGRGRTQRWLAPPVSGFTTTLLLPGPLTIG